MPQYTEKVFASSSSYLVKNFPVCVIRKKTISVMWRNCQMEGYYSPRPFSYILKISLVPKPSPPPLFDPECKYSGVMGHDVRQDMLRAVPDCYNSQTLR